jgi:flagella basal body P-ring formation protein FlgA
MRFVIRILAAIIVLTSAVSGETIEEYLRDEIITDYQLDSADVSISILRSTLSPMDVSAYEVKAYPLAQGDPVGRFPMRVELYRDGEMAERGSVSLDVRRYDDLLVPRQNIRRHELLAADMFEYKRFDITSISENMLSDPAQLDGCRAAQTLTAARMVPVRRIEKTPDVEYGAPITIIGKSRLFEIRAKGTAMQNGVVGETVKVKNDDSKKILTGTVIGPGRVEIDI